ncbi:MAG: ribonuclease HI family protein [Candidatus Pacebacteria bacterium]|nr:ribonuclease HI family protein [Candidatus Paceibacterota bacterium]
MTQIIINTDGGARGNPGPAGIGYVIKKDETVTLEKGEYIGETTNNQAEYEALVRALTALKTLLGNETDATIEARLDSELVVKQLRREYKVKDAGLKTQFAKVQEILATLPKVSFVHVMREDNSEADALVNEALDAQSAKIQ